MKTEIFKLGSITYNAVHAEKRLVVKPQIVKEYTAGGVRMYAGVGKQFNAELFDKAFGKPTIGK